MLPRELGHRDEPVARVQGTWPPKVVTPRDPRGSPLNPTGGGNVHEVVGSLRGSRPEHVQEGGASGHRHRLVIELALGTPWLGALHHQLHRLVPQLLRQRLSVGGCQCVCKKPPWH